MMTRLENIELSGRHGHANVEDLLIWIEKQTDADGKAILLGTAITVAMVDEMFELGRSEWVRRHIADMKRMMEFQYGRGVTGCRVSSMRRMADVLANDLRSMNAKWRIDDMTVPEWAIVDGNVEVRFRYDSARYSEQLRITA